MAFSKTWPSGVAALQVLTHTEFTALDNDHANAVDKTGDTITSGHTITWGYGAILALANGGAINGVAGAAFNFAGDMLLTGGLATFTAEAGTTFVLKGTCGVYAGATFDVSGASTRIKTASGGRIVLGDNDYPTFSATRNFARGVSLAGIVLPSGTTGWTVGANGLTSTASGANISNFAVPQRLMDGATLASIDLYVTPSTTTATLGGLFTAYRRTLATGAGLAAWTSLGSVSISGASWTDGLVHKVTATVGAVISAADQFSFSIGDQTGGAYAGGSVYHHMVFNYTAGGLLMP